MESKLAPFLVFFTLGLFTLVEAECPYIDYNICSCYQLTEGLSLQCNGYYYSDSFLDRVQVIINSIPYSEPIVNLEIRNIRGLNYVSSDYLNGMQIPQVTFQCYQDYSVSSSQLIFSLSTFQSARGQCTLGSNITIEDCNLRQFNAELFANCDQLESVVLWNNNVEEIIRFPELTNLKNLTVKGGRTWSGATQQGLTKLEISSELIPNLVYLDLSTNKLSDGDIGFISQLNNVSQVYLNDNLFSAIPDLTSLYNLETFKISLNKFVPDLSLLLPNPRKPVRYLNITVESSFNYTSLSDLQGDFNSTYINLLFGMSQFNETAFFEPLRNLNVGYVTLKSTPTYECKCTIAWLVRDYPNLLSRVRNGYCKDGTPFEQIDVIELSCCPVNGLVDHMTQLEKLNENLTNENQRLKEEIRLLLTNGIGA